MATCADIARREAARQRRRGQRQHPAGAARHGQSTAARGAWCIIPSTARSPSGRAIGSSSSAPAPAAGATQARQRRRRGTARPQLYDLNADLGERNNVQAEHPEVVARLTKLLEKYIADGRSTPGPKQANDAAIRIRKESHTDATKEEDSHQGSRGIVLIACWKTTSSSAAPLGCRSTTGGKARCFGGIGSQTAQSARSRPMTSGVPERTHPRKCRLP